MLAIRPLLNTEVQHWHPPTRNIHGAMTKAGSTFHRARIVNTPGKVAGVVSRENMPDAAATVWLLNHPRAITIGDTFELPSGEVLKVARVERCTSGTDTLSKVYLT